MPACRCFLSVVVAICLAFNIQPARADYYFTDQFNGPTFNSNLVDIDGTYAFTGGQARDTGPRNYVRTVENDYYATDFRAELIYNISGLSGASGVFFGMGAGTKDTAIFDEPESAIYFADHPSNFTDSQLVVRVNRPGPGLTSDPHYDPFFDGNIYLRITKMGDSLTFQYQHNYDGVNFNPEGSYSTSILATAPFLATGPSYLLFGTGASPTRFNSISVQPIPEPTSLATLVGIVVGAIGLRMRRFNR